MPHHNRNLKSKSKRSRLKSFLYRLVPCLRNPDVHFNTTVPPALIQARPPVPSTTKLDKTQATPDIHDKPVDDRPNQSVLPSVQSHSHGNPREGVPESVPRNSRDPQGEPPSLGHLAVHTSLIRDPTSEQQTLSSTVPVEPVEGIKPLTVNSQSGGTSILHGANDFRLETFIYNEAPKSLKEAGESPPDPRTAEGWGMLLARVVPSALHNSKDQFSAPKCDEGTRTEVIDETMGWLGGLHHKQGLLCMTGSSGAGKSALQQTIAEELVKKKTPFATFFFSKDDPSRNNTSSVISTIAYQLGLGYPELRHLIGAVVKDDPLLFTKSLQAQMAALLVDPINQLWSKASHNVQPLPSIILIDGLNECAEERSQAELLAAINNCILCDALHLRFIVSSRIGWAIQTILMPRGEWLEHIYRIHFTMDKRVTHASRMSWKRLQPNAKERERPSRRRTMDGAASGTAPIASAPATASGATWTTCAPRRTASPNIHSSRSPRRSQSVPPTRFYFYQSPAQVIGSPSNFAGVGPTFPPPFSQALLIQTPPEEVAMLSWYLNPDEVPDSAATDMSADELYPPSPINGYPPGHLSDLLPRRGKRDSDEGTLNTPVEGPPYGDGVGQDQLDPTPMPIRPKPIRAFVPIDDDSPLPGPSTFRSSPTPFFGPRSRSPSPTFLGDPRRTFTPERRVNMIGVQEQGRGKRRRPSLPESLLYPPFPVTARSERVGPGDGPPQARKRRRIPLEIPHSGHDSTKGTPEVDVD